MKLSDKVFKTLSESTFIAQDSKGKDLKIGDIVYFNDEGKNIITKYKGNDEGTNRAKNFVDSPMKIEGTEKYNNLDVLVLTLGLEEEGDTVKALPKFLIKK